MRKLMKNIVILIVGILALSTWTNQLIAASSKNLYVTKNCVTCHGKEGKKPLAPSYPKLNGQNAAYLLQQMKDIKSGKRSNGLSVTMKPMVASVSDSDMKAIADYLSKVK